jgi:ABC-type transport system involved in multi-copper enzyme maturation permease subunit
VLLGLGGLGLAALLGFANAAIAGDPGTPELGSAAMVENVLGVSTIPAAVALLLGVLLSAGEHQHGTITTTFLVTPRRRRVVVAKAVAAAVAGVVVAAAMIAVAALAAAVVVQADGAGIDAWHRGAATTVLGLLLASALLGAIGVLLGLLLRSQVATIVAVVAWFTVVEAVAGTIAGSGLRRWLPGAAAAELAGDGGQPLAEAFLVVTAWAVVAAAMTLPAVTRRDVT